MTSDLILGTPFLTQIYPFYVNEIGPHTKIMGKTISFKFLTAAKQREIASLQSASIYKQINTITSLQKKVKSLQHILHHVRQRVQTFPEISIVHPYAFILSLQGPQQIVAIIFIIFKFQNNFFIKRFLLRINCKSAKEILQKDVQNLVSKQIFAKWQTILSEFNFQIDFIKSIYNSLPDFLTREFLQETSDTNNSVQEQKMSSIKNKNKKDKGKAIQKAEDYQLQIPVQNQFTPLTQTQFPPLPYKTAVTNPNSSSSTNDYMIRFIEHILLTSCKPPPPTNIIPSITQKTFGPHQFSTDDLRKS